MLVQFTLDEIDLLESRMRHDIQQIDHFVETHNIRSSLTHDLINSAKMRREKILLKLDQYRKEVY